MLLDQGPNFVNDEPPFGSPKFAMPEIENALLKLDINKGLGTSFYVGFVVLSTLQ
jgi:hypothetical protein